MTQSLRTAYLVLCLATLAAVLWTLFMGAVYPIGPVDLLHAQFRPRLLEVMGDEAGRPLFSELSGFVARRTQSAALTAAIPLLLTLFGWTWIATKALAQLEQQGQSRDPMDG